MRPLFAPTVTVARPWRVTRVRATAEDVLAPDELDELVACQHAADLADRPGEPPCARAELLAQLAPPYRGTRFVHLAHDRSGRLVGYARLGIYGAFHRELAHATLTVHPSARRHGVGSALLEELAGAAAANGRRRLVLDGPRNAATEAFARSSGLAVSSCDLRSRLTLADPALAALLAAAIAPRRSGAPERLAEPSPEAPRAESAARGPHRWHASETPPPASLPAPRSGPDLLALRWAGPCPEYLLDALTGTLDTLHADPDDPSVTPFTPAEVRHRERAADRAGLREYTACLLDAETGSIAALSTAHTADGVRGEQNETVVVPAYRGQGLAIRVKAYLVRELLRAEPGLRVLETYNAVGNTRILAVNRRLGFVPVDTHAAWTMPL
ncbi:GNAT family N-acetyltransferase [Actinospica durhamensis]|uniref:GNAT family N-acetyltransferase n=1 Tax=Actinospica durhamensis TaxID=1508375 RepID=A0A941ESB9_9ACTN|nr:GNAT family N-acetyltransferase [Actinospica durhamensis]MBR7837152.1 GNAT family N-acetyltransferase [Actinospica durhamensis]